MSLHSHASLSELAHTATGAERRMVGVQTTGVQIKELKEKEEEKSSRNHRPTAESSTEDTRVQGGERAEQTAQHNIATRVGKQTDTCRTVGTRGPPHTAEQAHAVRRTRQPLSETRKSISTCRCVSVRDHIPLGTNMVSA